MHKKPKAHTRIMGRAKPMLVIVPPNFLSQRVYEIRDQLPMAKVHIYHPNFPGSIFNADWIQFYDKSYRLHAVSAIFNGNEESAL